MQFDEGLYPHANSRYQLEAGITQLESLAKQNRHDSWSTRSLGSVAMLLGLTDLADRAVRLLQSMPRDAWLADALTNIEPSESASQAIRVLGRVEDLEKRYPPYVEYALTERIRGYAEVREPLAHCLAGRFQDARDCAGSGLKLEEVGLTLAVLGEFDVALSIADDEKLDSFRRENIRFVAMIERFRRGRVETAYAMLVELESNGMNYWAREELALGFADRMPWFDYPFPDW